MNIKASVKLGTTKLLDMSMPMTIKTDMNLKELDKSVMAFSGKLNMTIDPSLANGGRYQYFSRILTITSPMALTTWIWVHRASTKWRCPLMMC